MKPIEEITVTKGWFGTETEYTTLWYQPGKCGATRTSKTPTPKRKPAAMTVPTMHPLAEWTQDAFGEKTEDPVFQIMEDAEPPQPAQTLRQREQDEMEGNVDAMLNLTTEMASRGAHLADDDKVQIVADATAQAIQNISAAFNKAQLPNYLGSDLTDAILHSIYTQTKRATRRVDHSLDAIKDRIREEDGSEIGGIQIERAQAKGLVAEREEAIWEGCLEAAEHAYLSTAGKPWNPNENFAYKWASTNASHLAAEAYILSLIHI